MADNNVYGLQGGSQRGLISKKPVLPADFSADADSDTEITLTWVEGTTAPVWVQIDWSEDEAVWTPLAEIAGGVETFTHSELTAATQYFYRLRVYKGMKWSGYDTDDDTTDAE